MLFVNHLYNIGDMKSKKSSSNNTKEKKKNAIRGNKKISIANRHKGGEKISRTLRTRQQRISKIKRSNRKKHQQEVEPQIAIKRSSGHKERFDTNRMAQTVGRSGVPFLMARDVAKKVSNKIKNEVYTQRQTKGRRSGNKSKHTQLKEKL